MVRPHWSFGTLFDCKSLNLKVCCSLQLWIKWLHSVLEPKNLTDVSPGTSLSLIPRPSPWRYLGPHDGCMFWPLLCCVKPLKLRAMQCQRVMTRKTGGRSAWWILHSNWWNFICGFWSWQVCGGMVWACHTKGMQMNSQNHFAPEAAFNRPLSPVEVQLLWWAHLEWTILVSG